MRNDLYEFISSGDKISAGGLLLEIKTDKADIDVEAEEDGILAKILVILVLKFSEYTVHNDIEAGTSI